MMIRITFELWCSLFPYEIKRGLYSTTPIPVTKLLGRLKFSILPSSLARYDNMEGTNFHMVCNFRTNTVVLLFSVVYLHGHVLYEIISMLLWCQFWDVGSDAWYSISLTKAINTFSARIKKKWSSLNCVPALLDQTINVRKIIKELQGVPKSIEYTTQARWLCWLKRNLFWDHT